MAIPILTVAPREMKGLNQAIDANLLDLSYSPDCQNIDVSEGILSVRGGSEKWPWISAAAPYPIRKIFQFAASALQITIIGTRDGFTYRWYAWLSNAWSQILFESTSTPLALIPEFTSGLGYPVSGAPNYLLLAPDEGMVRLIYTGGLIKAISVSSAPYGDFLTLHRERIWIARMVSSTVYYSNAFNPTDWTTAGQTGEIKIETGDGDRIIGIANLLDDIIIFKQNTMWRVSGDIPSEYSLSQVYAEQGVKYPESICSDGSYCFFAGADGIYQYTGNDAVPVLTDAIKNWWKSLVAGSIPSRDIKCTLNDGILHVWNIGSLNGKQISYDVRKKRITVIKAQTVYDSRNNAVAVAIPSSTPVTYVVYTDGEYIYRLRKTDLKFGTANIEAYWITPETDLGSPNASKTLTDMYFTGWGSTNAGAAGGQVKITAYYNESGTQKNKEKTVTLQISRKLHNVQWNVTGRLFKFKIENVSGSIFNLSNLQFVFEVDRD